MTKQREKKTSPPIRSILKNDGFDHFIETVNDAFAILLFELGRGQIGGKNGV